VADSGLNSVTELIADIRAGKMIILMDDEDRENEGDLVMAAEQVTPEAINFMVSHARGLVCLPLTEERCQQLGLGLMTHNNNAPLATNFTVSIEAARGVTTGISAADRACTIQAAVAANAKPTDLVQPGHVFPIRAMPGGVLRRAGHTEASCDLARLAGFSPAAVVVEILNADGSMARRPQLERFAKQHQLKMGTIADLIQYRMLNETSIECLNHCTINNPYGEFELYSYRDNISGELHLALVKGQPQPDQPVLVRVHLADTLKDLLAVSGLPGSWPLAKAMAYIARQASGVLVLLSHQSTAGELEQQIACLAQSQVDQSGDQEEGCYAKPANTQLAYRTIGTGSQILRHLGVGKMRLMSSPIKFNALSGFDLEIVEYVASET
jgi:3,4-dihydroxy 2-butanone 4-phosphate synthase/GTP cyclohydrolase II